jgi:hypothetical protein
MIRCTLCGDRMARSQLCSDLAVITLHWMSKHRERYLKSHPEAAPYI